MITCRWMMPVFLALSLGAPAWAAPTAPAPVAAAAEQEAPAPKRFSLTLEKEPPRAALARIAKESGELVLPDSTVNRGEVTATWKDVTVEEAVADLCRQVGLSWKRVYLPPGTAASGDNVSQIYRSLRALHAGGLVAFEPGSGRGTMLLLNVPLPQEYQSVMERPNTGFRRAYLVLNQHQPLVPGQQPVDDGEPWRPGEQLTPEKMARLQRDTMAALSQLSPEQRQAALQASMQSQMEIFTQNPQLMAQFVKEAGALQMRFVMEHPEVFQTVMQSAMQAQIEMLQEMPAEQLQQIMKMQMEAAKQIPPETMQRLMELMRGVQPPQ